MGSTITSSVTLGKAVHRDEPWSYRAVRGIPISVLHLLACVALGRTLKLSEPQVRQQLPGGCGEDLYR